MDFESINKSERYAAFIKNYEIMVALADYMADGGSEIDFAATHDVPFSVVMKMTRFNDHHKQLYAQAEQDRDLWIKKNLLNELKNFSMADIRQIYDDKGKIKPMADWPDQIARAIESYENNDGVVKVRLVNKLKSKELLGKTQSMFTEKVEHTASDSLASLIVQTYNQGKTDGDKSGG